MESQATAEMPKYKSHKTVWALKIKELIYDWELANKENRETDGSLTIVPAEEGYGPIKVEAKFVPKHDPARPQVGWYFVQYSNGYKSFSPADAFEEGYMRI